MRSLTGAIIVIKQCEQIFELEYKFLNSTMLI